MTGCRYFQSGINQSPRYASCGAHLWPCDSGISSFCFTSPCQGWLMFIFSSIAWHCFSLWALGKLSKGSRLDQKMSNSSSATTCALFLPEITSALRNSVCTHFVVECVIGNVSSIHLFILCRMWYGGSYLLLLSWWVKLQVAPEKHELHYSYICKLQSKQDLLC